MATAKKTTKKAAPRKTAATRTTAPKTTASKAAAAKPAAAPVAKDEQGFRLGLGNIDLGDLDVRTVIADSAYATVGAGDRAVEIAKDLPERLEELRKARTEQAEGLVKEYRDKVQDLVKDAPAKLQAELDDVVATARKEFEAHASRGRKVMDSFVKADGTKKVLDSTEDVRTQVTSAVTGLRKYVEQGQEAAEKAAERLGLRRSA